MSKTVTFYYDIVFSLLDHQMVLIKDSGCFDQSIKDCIKFEIRNPRHQHGDVNLINAVLVNASLILVFTVTFDSKVLNRLKLTDPKYLNTLVECEQNYTILVNAVVETYSRENGELGYDAVRSALKEAGYA